MDDLTEYSETAEEWYDAHEWKFRSQHCGGIKLQVIPYQAAANGEDRWAKHTLAWEYPSLLRVEIDQIWLQACLLANEARNIESRLLEAIRFYREGDYELVRETLDRAAEIESMYGEPLASRRLQNRMFPE